MPMSQMGHKPTFAAHKPMSALPLRADIKGANEEAATEFLNRWQNLSLIFIINFVVVDISVGD
jgi:hypothetical protein